MTNYNVSRLVATVESLEKLVVAVVQANVDQKQSFSAHNITEQIRALVQGVVEINHEQVKPMVHKIMRGVANYTASNTGTFIWYEPVATGYNFVFGDNGTPVLANKAQAVLGAPEHWEDFYPQSTAIERMRYEYNSNTLKIVFTSSSDEYSFFNVPLSVWIAFKVAESKGKFFYRYIKGNYQEG